MLKLNAIKDEETRLEENLNTSHVKVKLLIMKIIIICHLYLNTSHVKVKRKSTFVHII